MTNADEQLRQYLANNPELKVIDYENEPLNPLIKKAVDDLKDRNWQRINDPRNTRGPARTAVTVQDWPQAMEKRSGLEITMEWSLKQLIQTRDHLANYKKEYRFAAMEAGGTGKGVRKRLESAGLKDWRFDFAWPDFQIAIEVEGGQWTNGRHQRGKGFEDDCEKYNHAAFLGWLVFRFTSDMVKDGRALAFLESIFPEPMILAI